MLNKSDTHLTDNAFNKVYTLLSAVKGNLTTTFYNPVYGTV